MKFENIHKQYSRLKEFVDKTVVVSVWPSLTDRLSSYFCSQENINDNFAVEENATKEKGGACISSQTTINI